MALSYSNITVEIKEVFLKNRPQELYDVSPKGTVPVLSLSNSTIIEESIDIMKWALEQKDMKSWFISNINSQMEMIMLYDDEFKYWLDRYKYHDRFPENNKTFYMEKCHIFLSRINNLLKGNSYLFSNKISLADIAIFPFIRQCANVDVDWFANNYINTSKWLDHFTNSKLFLSVMDKYPEYKSKQKPLIINFNK